jgi:uncharacterized protein
MEPKINLEIEQRPQSSYRSIEIRVSADAERRPIIDGHAAVFNKPSEEIFSVRGWREIIRPGAFSKAIKTDDVRALINHKDDRLIGRVSNGTLQLDEDEKGLRSRIFPPDTTDGRDILALIRGGYMTQMSFGFTLDEDGERIDQQNKLREILSVKRLYDVSVVTLPAYPDTEVGLRTFFHAKITEIEQKSDPTVVQIALKEAFLAKIAARQAWLDARTPPPDPFDPKFILKSSIRK